LQRGPQGESRSDELSFPHHHLLQNISKSTHYPRTNKTQAIFPYSPLSPCRFVCSHPTVT
ncbi:hypothetical protein, partial [Serratia marcescens]|uniref:hypothetical protein n=1 Tax=Serratia marcescens TaxID=615 RepID=UPI001955278A